MNAQKIAKGRQIISKIKKLIHEPARLGGDVLLVLIECRDL